MLNGFENLEESNIQDFQNNNKQENEYISSLLEYFAEYLKEEILIDDYPKSTVYLFIGSNFDLLYQSFNMLKKGYFRPCLILLRPVYESIALCMYFWEFPEKEEEYRKARSKIEWLKKQGYNQGIIKTIEEKGKIFNKARQPEFLSNLIANPLREINNYVHFNTDYIYTAASLASKEGLFLGPRPIEQIQRNGLSISLLEATLFSLMVLEKAVKPHNKEFIDEAKKIIDFLHTLRERNKDYVKKEGNARPNP